MSETQPTTQAEPTAPIETTEAVAEVVDNAFDMGQVDLGEELPLEFYASLEDQFQSPQPPEEDRGQSEEETDQSTEESPATETSESSETVTDPDKAYEDVLALARREKELRGREESLSAQIEQGVKDQFRQMESLLVTDPVAFLSQAGVDPEKNTEIAELLLYAALGEDAPDAYKERHAELQRDIKMQSLEQRQADWEKKQTDQAQQARDQAAYSKYMGELHGYLDAIKPEDYTYLSTKVQREPDVCRQWMENAANYLFEQTGNPPTAKDVAQAIEAELERSIAPYLQSTGQRKQSGVPQTQTTRQTLSNNMAGSTSATSATEPPPDVDEAEWYLEQAQKKFYNI